MSVKSKRWTVAKMFEGEPKMSDFQLVEEEIPTALKPGEVLVEALYLTVDPYMRWRSYEAGETLIGEQVGRIKVSNNSNFPEGTLVLAYTGWRTHSLVSNTEENTFLGPIVKSLPDFGELSPSLAIGCLGMPGLTAYFGLLERGEVKAGETVLVSAAAGAVGSVVGQIAKIKGCKVIGSAGSDEKCDWLKEIGFDHVFNYKTQTVDDALTEFAPEGVDVYFDNVGGDFTYDVLKSHIKFGGRIVACGSVSSYNKSEDERTERSIAKFVIYKELNIRGFIIGAHVKRFAEGLSEMLRWVREGKIKYKETVTEGFENMPNAFISLLRGGNIGKALVKV
ncbi:hypothetical protein C0Q70_14665 [Pomacea canaliculata]|uniref:Prostaglandin reductase 1 n=1 Tax=Pomacea canaliculata TaxID=400727 RepID=A0A2T7NSQ8_POMCA|nr:prostaglandin reductase 1-like [Pomacea canaliculata]PVD24195.1 hypothetical protein C0Q70_14665 [Pomacea canaliculata]